MKPSVCKACGCQCTSCGNESATYFDLHQQIAELHSQLQRSGSHIASIEHELMDSKQAMDMELIKTKEDLNRLRERYDRLLESHKRMQKINHDLEDKLLTLVNQFEMDKLSLQKELSTMMNKLVDARMLINELDEESEKYRSDCNTAVQLLQCKPSDFVAHKLNSLPLDLQERVRQHMSRDQLLAAESANQDGPHDKDGATRKLIRVPIATFPPTAMVFSLNSENSSKQRHLPTIHKQQHNSSDGIDSDIKKGYVPMSIIARVLAQKRKRGSYPRMFLCMSCKKDVFHMDEGCQVDLLPSRGSRTVEISTRPISQGYVHDSISRLGQSSTSQDSEKGSSDESGGLATQTRVYRLSSGSETNL